MTADTTCSPVPRQLFIPGISFSETFWVLGAGCGGPPSGSSQTWNLGVGCFLEEGSGSEGTAMPGPGDVFPQELWAHTGALQIPQERTCGRRKGHGDQVASKSSLNHQSPLRQSSLLGQ